METLIVGLATALVTALGSWQLHKREVAKGETATEIATAALHRELDARMRDHVIFVEERIKTEREWYERELEREKADCADSINTLAGRLGVTEARLRDFQRTKRISWEGGVSEAEPEGDDLAGGGG
jgi:hypothetical protein